MNDDLDEFKRKFMRNVRATGNSVLDAINQLSQPGGLSQGFEQIGGGQDPDSGGRVSPPKSASEKTIRDYYANLEVEYGADMDTVKESYRNLMRKYHPDKFTHDPSMEAKATSLTQEITYAYRAIESYHKTGKY